MEVQWTDEIGVVHTVRNADQIIQELFTEWPGGFDEINASVESSATWVNWLEAKLAEVRDICAGQLTGISDINSNDALREIIKVVDREYDYRTGK